MATLYKIYKINSINCSIYAKWDGKIRAISYSCKLFHIIPSRSILFNSFFPKALSLPTDSLYSSLSISWILLSVSELIHQLSNCGITVNMWANMTCLFVQHHYFFSSESKKTTIFTAALQVWYVKSRLLWISALSFPFLGPAHCSSDDRVVSMTSAPPARLVMVELMFSWLTSWNNCFFWARISLRFSWDLLCGRMTHTKTLKQTK